MFFSILYELGPFILVFVLFIGVFTLFQIILGVEVSENGSDYPGVNKFIRMFI